MKKRLITVFVVMAVLTICLSLFTACLFGGNDDGKDDTPKVYKIQYTDDDGLHTLEVTQGEMYSIAKVPEKKGYKFVGLFDAQTGGKQYVLANGTSAEAFDAGKNIVLYPQFTANEYSLILDYQNAQVTGERQYSVKYGANLPELPKDVTLEHQIFQGWYTMPNCQGVKVADQYGLVPLVSVINDSNFDLSSGTFTLYAGFEVEKFTVTCYFGAGINTEDIQVAYDTPISQVVPTTRVDGKAPLTWSRQQGGDPFTGKITSDIILYALDFAPVIELDVNGGEKINAIVAREGTSISLPIPVKSLCKFMYWEDEQGKETTLTTMPTTSVSLKAVWQASIVFDENGGSEVADISLPAGEEITLPTPEKDGYIFAGWYTNDKEVYSATKMPSSGIALKAGWYEGKEKVITIIENSTNKKVTSSTNTISASSRKRIDISSILPNIPEQGVKIKYTLKFKWGNADRNYSAVGQVALYDGNELNSAYRIGYKSLSHTDAHDAYINESISGEAVIYNNILYWYYCGKGNGRIYLNGGFGYDVDFFDVSLNITYPDTSKLYL